MEIRVEGEKKSETAGVTEGLEIVCILDRSGSMDLLKRDAIGSFNTFLEEQKKLPDDGARITVVLFNQEYKVLHELCPVKEVQPLTEDTYQPSGTTALLEAVCRTLEQPSRLRKGVVAILTDGFENASAKEYSKERVAKAIKALEDRGWEVHYLAANQDAFAEGGSMGIATANAFSYAASPTGIRTAYSNIGFVATNYRNSNSTTGDE